MWGLGFVEGREKREGATDNVTRGRDQGMVRRRGDKGSKIANAKVIALRLSEPVRRNYFSCTRSDVFIGRSGVPLRLLARDDRSWCESCASVFLGARD